MKTELRLLVSHGQQLVEIWWSGRMIGQITGGDDGPGVRIISKYPLTPIDVPNERATPVHIIEVRVGS